MKKFALAAALLGLFGLLTVADARAADKDDPTGTWKVKTKLGKKDIDAVMKFENKDGTVTGTVTRGGDKTEAKIEDGTFKDGELKFSITREVKDVKVVTKYTAKVTGDTIKGTGTFDFNGKEVKVDFEGTKEKK